MNVELKKEGSKLIITPKESIDSKTSPDLEKVVNEAIDGSVTELEFLMGDVDFISSAGIRALLSFRKKIGSGKDMLARRGARTQD